MTLLTLEKVCLAFGDQDILKNVDFTLTEKSKIALTGANGSGKTTFMKILAGFIPPDRGKIHRANSIRITYLPQEGITHEGTTLYEEAEEGFSYIDPILEEKKTIESTLSTCREGDERVQAFVKRQHQLQEYITESGYYDRKRIIESMLLGLGFRTDELRTLTDSFSAGWQMRIALVKTLLSRPDLLLLDEPTNYLDLEARTWLKTFLETYSGSFIIVSHDRNFLDATVNTTAELFLASVHLYSGNYSEYERQRKQELTQLYDLYEQQREEIAKTEQFINKFRYNAAKAKQVQSRIKYLEKIEPIEIPEHLKPFRLSFPPPERTGDIVIETDNLSKTYNKAQDSRTAVFSNLQLTLERGEKCGVVGINGAGKTTLLRILAGRDEDYEGTVRYGSKVRIGYYSEELLRLLQSEESIIDLLESEAPTHLVSELRTMLGAFLFSGDDIYKPTTVLSGGEKSRLAILRMMLHPINVLILDEPTNHLDIHSKDILLEALRKYQGTIIFVSHDRYFLEHLSTRIVELQDGKARVYPGGYSYYMWKKEQIENKTAEAPEELDKKEAAPGKISYEEEKKRKNTRRQREKQETDLIAGIQTIEEEIIRLHDALNDPAVYSDHEKAGEIHKKIQQAEEKQHTLMRQWEELT